MGGPVANGVFDKVMEAIKQLGVPIVISAVLLWFFLVRVDAIIQDIQKAQVRIEDAVTTVRGTQSTIEVQIREWILRGCPNVPVQPPPGGTP